MKEWNGKLNRIQAIKILDSVTDQDDPYWENIVGDHYDEESDTLPSIYHVFAALGVTEQEYKAATGADNVNWPTSIQGRVGKVQIDVQRGEDG